MFPKYQTKTQQQIGVSIGDPSKGYRPILRRDNLLRKVLAMCPRENLGALILVYNLCAKRSERYT